LSRRYCGAASLGYQTTGEFWGGRLSLGDALAISGAAVSPLQITNWLIVILMVILNARTGQWLPRPRDKSNHCPKEHPNTNFLSGISRKFLRWASCRLAGTPGPSFLGLALDRICGTRDRRRLYFVTDGGHHENLGLWPLLERRCRLVIASDASEDGTS